MARPLAYFLTWTCYGQRLHGDERGSVDKLHNQPGTPQLPPDPARERADRARMVHAPVTLTSAMRQVSDAAIRALCEQRAWRLLAVNVRTTHVHAVLRCDVQTSPERAMAALKARATDALREAGLATAAARVWAHHGSTRWINHYPGLYGAIAYTNDWQSGANREIKDEHRRAIRAQLESLKEYLRLRGLPEDGRTVVAGETAEERERRLHPERVGERQRLERNEDVRDET